MKDAESSRYPLQQRERAHSSHVRILVLVVGKVPTFLSTGLKALSKLNREPATTVDAPPAAPDAGPVISPYVISNRYYTADVHFAAYTLQTVFPGLFSLDRGPDYKPPPALIFVWVAGEVRHALTGEMRCG